MQLDNVYNFEIANLTFLDSPEFNLAIRGSFIHIHHMNITSNAQSCSGWESAPNTDGINIGGHDIFVHDSFIHNGDDCIPTNTGIGNADSYNILVERVHCECGTNGGVPIMANNASIYNVTYRDMVVKGTNQGAGVKISEPYDSPGGLVYNVTWQNITIIQPRYAPLYLNTYQEDATDCALPPSPDRGPKWMSIQNVTFSNIRAVTNTSEQESGCFLCSPGRPCTGIVFDNVTVTNVDGSAAAPYICNNTDVVNLDGASSPMPCDV